MTSDTFNVLSSSDLNINSGGTLTNAGTAYGFDNLPAYAGVLEANTTFVDQAIFGPAVDGMPWNGRWTANDSSGDLLYSSLMLVTIEDATADTQINIWDLTEQSAGAISTSAIATITLTGDATPTSVAACMGYIIVGSEDGASIVDPHSGAWAERTAGWPRTLSTSTSPALAANTVNSVGAGLTRQPAFDSRTGGPLPTFAVSYSGGSQAFSVIKNDGNVYDRSGTGHNAVVSDGRLIVNLASVLSIATDIDTITADTPSVAEVGQAGSANNLGFASDVDDGVSIVGNDLAYASSTGFTRSILNENVVSNGTGIFPLNALINRTYNTGFLPSVARGVWIANSKTADRGAFSNTLSEEGSVTLGVAETSSEIQAVSGLDTSNYLYRANDADFAPTTGNFSVMGWFKTTATAAVGTFISYGVAGTNTNRWLIQLQATTSVLRFMERDSAGNNAEVDTGSAVDDSVWHQFAGVVDRTADILYLYIDGVLDGSTSTSGLVSLTNTSQQLEIGISNSAGTPDSGAGTTSLSLLRYSATAPTATQIRQMYDAEKGMFVASAKCLLQSGSTDAVLDVDVDPLTRKVIVTQTDKINIFDGLVNVSQPTVESGASEKGKLWGALRAEQNDANAYVTAPVTDQRQVNEMVRGLASDLPAGPDLSKAKAWVKFDGSGTIAIQASYNVKSLTDVGTGDYLVNWAIPFKQANGYVVQVASRAGGSGFNGSSALLTGSVALAIETHAGARNDSDVICVSAFGELENE